MGSITLDLAEIVAPGQVVGLDTDPSQLERARALARQRGRSNVRFAVGNVYTLPFPDASFDAALAHTLLVHLSEPLYALKEMHRVVKPAGLLAVSDDDYSTVVSSPANSPIELVWKLWVQLLTHNGGSPYYSRHLRQLLLQAGCSKTEGYAVAAEYYGRREDTRRFALVMEQIFRDPAVVEVVLGEGWAEPELLESMIVETKAWAERPDAFFAWMYCAAVGWVDGQAS
jgi:ubiquinone/menaquinone biosynthesis C-methylase UbiE